MHRPRIFDRVEVIPEYQEQFQLKSAGEIQELSWAKRDASDDFPDGRCVLARVKFETGEEKTIAVNLLRPARKTAMDEFKDLLAKQSHPRSHP